MRADNVTSLAHSRFFICIEVISTWLLPETIPFAVFYSDRRKIAENKLENERVSCASLRAGSRENREGGCKGHNNSTIELRNAFEVLVKEAGVAIK